MPFITLVKIDTTVSIWALPITTNINGTKVAYWNINFIHANLKNIGFSSNGEGENKILDPEGKNSCPSGEAARARILA